MRKFAIILVFVFGVVFGRLSHSTMAEAQIPSPSYVCDFGPSGNTSVFPCAQYLVTVSPQRLGGGVAIYQVLNTPFPVAGNDANLLLVGAGPLHQTGIEAFVPGSSAVSFSLTVQGP